MIAIWLYFIVILLLTIFGFIRKWNPLGKILLLLYFVLALIALFIPSNGSLQYVSKLDDGIVTIPIIIFMLISYLLFFRPFLQKNNKLNVNNLCYKLNQNYKFFVYIYIILAIIYIIVYFSYVISLIKSGNWAANRLMMFEDTAMYPDKNIIEKFAILFVNYTQLLALIISFLLLRDRKYKRIGILLLVLICICELCSDLYVSSRGMIAQFSILLLAMYFFFYPSIDKKNKRFINLMILFLAFTIGPYLAAVTLSRFSTQVINSLVYYFGQTPYVFSLEVKKLIDPMYGRFAVGVLFGDTKYLSTYGSWDHMFYTFVGWLYADWSWIGTFCIGIVIPFLFGRLVKKERIQMCDIYILFAYYKMLIQGAFTIGRTRIYEMIATIVIYFLMKFIFDKYTFVIARSNKNITNTQN